MSRVDLSPEQLDAMAAVRSPRVRVPISPLFAWQAHIASEPPLRLTSRHPAAITYALHRQEDEEGGEVEIVIEASQIGADLSSALVDYIDGSRTHRFPLHDALMAWDRVCRRRHSRWADHRGKPVCAEIAWSVLRDRTSLLFAANEAGVSWTRAERLLLAGIDFMRSRQEAWLRKQERIVHDREHCVVCREEAG